MNGFEVLQPGPLSLLQDQGRQSFQHLGLSPCGPLDLHAAAWANRLLDNRWGTPVLEVALGGLGLRCLGHTRVALCGADVPVSLDGESRSNWSCFAVSAGQCLQLGYVRSGQRAYLAVPGGFNANLQLGSVATQQREGLGGLHGDGSALRSGDRLYCEDRQQLTARSVPARFQPDYRLEPTLRLITGGEALHFTEHQLHEFFNQRWLVSRDSDRMGCRLAGTPVALPAPSASREWSRGVSTGAVQIPADGQPIVLLADHQSMGGYPLIGWVHPLDLGRLAQCPAGHGVRFLPISLEDAQNELLGFYGFFGR